jgi:hypothetical protein
VGLLEVAECSIALCGIFSTCMCLWSRSLIVEICKQLRGYMLLGSRSFLGSSYCWVGCIVCLSGAISSTIALSELCHVAVVFVYGRVTKSCT